MQNFANAQAQSQFLSGLNYLDNNQLDKAITAWESIKREDNKEAYASAQLNLGVVYKEQEQLDKAIAAWERIKREDNKEYYAMAQFNLGVVYLKQKQLDKAIAAWERINCEDNREAYEKAQFNLGVAYKEQKQLNKAIESFERVLPRYYFIAKYNILILELIKKDIEEVTSELENIFEKTCSVIQKLYVNKNSFEDEVAHYTGVLTALKILDKQNPSALRLGTIKNVNDPQEGNVLHHYIKCRLNNKEKQFDDCISTSSIEKSRAFISCFTFNHDSLNQFRLYGKTNGIEATGVSLVVSSENFFNFDDMIDFIKFPLKNKILEQSLPLENGLGSVKINKSEKDINKEQRMDKKLDKLPLLRCIYIDPESGYVRVACRDEITFYKEFYIKNEMKDLEQKWEEYQNNIKDINNKVQEFLDGVVNSISRIYDNKENNEEAHWSLILEILNFILLPLRYIVKHVAFQEEQECRMINITRLDDELIQSYVDDKQMYIEYSMPVVEALKKIYLSPGAFEYEDFLEFNLIKHGIEIRRSNNPFRNK